MLQLATLYQNEEIVVKCITATYNKPYREQDYNLLPTVSLPVGSCFKYRIGANEFLLNSNEVLLEKRNTEFEVGKFLPWKQDTTISILFRDGDHEFLRNLNKDKNPVLVYRRTARADYFARTIVTEKLGNRILSEQLVFDLLNEALSKHTELSSSNHILQHIAARVEQAKNFIHQNYSRKIQINDIAAAVFVSVFHFCRTFKKITGYSPYQYLMLVRLEEAKKLLQKRMSVTEAALQCGFESIEHFSHAFSRYENIPASVYRKNTYC
jgi:AraC-like DNA-binding protein